MLERLLKTNLNLKIVSIVLAAFLWFIVHLTQPTPAASIGESSFKVPLVMENLTPTLDVLEAPPSVFLTVKKTGGGLQPPLLKPSDFKASVDLDGKKAGVFRDLPVDIAAPMGYTVTGIQPEKVEVTLDNESDKTVPLQWKSPQQNAVEKISIMPQSVVVKGPESLVAQVSAALVVIPETINPLKSTLQLPPLPVDSLSRPIPNLSVIPEKVSVTIQLPNRVKTVVVRPVLTGALPGNLELSSVSASPATLLVEQTDIANEIDHLDTRPLVLNGTSAAGFTRQTSVVAPSGVKIIGSDQITVTVQVQTRAR